MNCPSCGSAESSVTETISTDVINYRRRKCPDCGLVFFTSEELSSTDEVRPIFNQRSTERMRKARAKVKGVDYVPEYEQSRADGPKRPTQKLF